jgi:hypothetical protein
MLPLIVLVLFIMTMFLWLLTLLTNKPEVIAYSPWLCWFSCLFLGLAVFLATSGIEKYAGK